MRDPRRIVITGASSGIGAALAHAYARPGAFLALVGRDAERLARVAEACRAAGADATTGTLDVTDAPRLAAWLLDIDRRQPLDLVIANAGISAERDESPDQALRIFAVNVDGVVNTVMPLLAPMATRGRGQIALMASLAAFRGFPGAAAYCASKACVRIWGEALRVDLAAKGIEVSVICPGFIDTPMTRRNPFPMPLLMDAGRAAEIIVSGLARNRGRIAFPWRMYAMVSLLSALPGALTDRMLQQAPRKI